MKISEELSHRMKSIPSFSYDKAFLLPFFKEVDRATWGTSAQEKA